MSFINVRLQSASQPDVPAAMAEVRTARCVRELRCQLAQRWDVRSCIIVLRSTTGAKVLLDSEMLVENMTVEVSLQGQDTEDQTRRLIEGIRPP
mmetsp:Transcript_41706/g.97383  ORF Transcript_41706/g.97383 Transcript_41706/m.97383 type:complete len:94 (+) Transcript_41706:43-324(+)|eukprot:s2683_g8.t1